MAGDSESKSPKTSNTAAPRSDAAADPKTQTEVVAKTEQPATDVAKPLAPPPRPSDTPDYFALHKNPSLTHEPNPFEKSFSGNGDPVLGAGAPETPGGTKLPPVSSITSPSALLPGPGGTTPFNWGAASLRTGPLSPAMLSGPQSDYFSQEYARGFPTPNESSLRSGLTPGGSGSMFPNNGGMPSPNTQAMFQLAVGSATPGTVDFHRAAMRAAQDQRQNQQPLPVTSQPQGANGTSSVKPENKSGPFDSQHDNDAANGLFMLAQGNRNGGQQQSQYPVPPQPAVAHGHPAPAVQHPDPQYNGNATRASNRRGISEAASDQSEDSQNRPNTRGRGKRTSGAGVAATNSRRKAEEPPTKAPATKKAKLSIGAPSTNGSDVEDDDDGMDENDGGKPKHKMTDEEKRKNFLERNRVAALKCRQRKKQWLANLQTKVDVYQQENDALSNQVAQLREEVVNLKTLLLAHKDCPVTQQQSMGQGSYMPPMDQYPQQQMHNYQMGQMNNYHPSMIPAGSSRRPS
ncbi:unnamed protein product [Discula destructiva]